MKSKKFLGNDLSGAKAEKTTIASISFYPENQKLFFLDLYHPADEVRETSPIKRQASDRELLAHIRTLEFEPEAIGVNVPLGLPPCLGCVDQRCLENFSCQSEEVQWMDQYVEQLSQKDSKILDFTPYTQRAVELWVRYDVFPQLGDIARTIDIDETLGGSRAPLTARMNYLNRHLVDFLMVEIWPKVTIAALAKKHQIPEKVVSQYRRIEQGVEAREYLLEIFSERLGIFFYEHDRRSLRDHLNAFDAFVCAYNAFLYHEGKCMDRPKFFPTKSPFIAVPQLSHTDSP